MDIENSSSSPFGTPATNECTELTRVSEAIVPGQGSDILSHLPAYQVQRLTEAQKEGLRKSLDPQGFLQMTPMICNDLDCPVLQANKCPLHRMQITRPLGEDCPVESAEVRIWEQKLFETLPREEQGDPFNVMLVRDIVLLQLIEQRAMIKLAQTGDIEQEITVGHGPDGSPLKSKDIHRGIQVYEKVRKLKDRLMSKLLATPQDKIKASASGMYDRSQAAAKLMEKMEEMQRKRDREKVVDAEFQVKSEDS